MSPRDVLREIRRYTIPIPRPIYDGDITLLSGRWPAFGVTWQNGLLYINGQLERVDWKPVSSLLIRRSYRLNVS